MGFSSLELRGQGTGMSVRTVVDTGIACPPGHSWAVEPGATLQPQEGWLPGLLVLSLVHRAVRRP